MDYASYILEAKKSIKYLEQAIEDKQYREAHEHALNALAELRLLSQLTKEKMNEEDTGIAAVVPKRRGRKR